MQTIMELINTNGVSMSKIMRTTGYSAQTIRAIVDRITIQAVIDRRLIAREFACKGGTRDIAA